MGYRYGRHGKELDKSACELVGGVGLIPGIEPVRELLVPQSPDRLDELGRRLMVGGELLEDRSSLGCVLRLCVVFVRSRQS